MKKAFLVCALSLRALPFPQDKLFNKLCAMYEERYPDRMLVLVNKDERLMGNEAIDLGIEFREHYRLWMQRAA